MAQDDKPVPTSWIADSSDTSKGVDEPIPSEFALDDHEEEWLGRLREAEQSDDLGTIGPYELLEEVSRGGQGIVYRARQPHTDRIIAIKRLLAGAYATPAARARFRREIQAEVALNHPNVVGVYGLDVVDGQPVLALEWIDGVPANKWAAGNGAAPKQTEILETFVKICDAVRHAHQRGVIHRDLKPSNILVDESGEPHVLDFGLARVVRPEDTDATRLTRTREFMGTPAYAVPEQLRGDADAIDVRSDVYALGVVLYEMLTGQTPYPSDAAVLDLIEAMRAHEPAPISSHDRTLDGDLDAIATKSLASEPSERYQSVDAFGSDVRRYLGGDPVEAKRHTFGYVLRKQLRKYRLPAAIVVGFVVLVTAALVVSLAGWRAAEHQRMIAEEAGTAAKTAQIAAEAALAAETTQRHRAETVTGLIVTALGAADPHAVKGRNYTVRMLLDEFARDVAGGLATEPEVEAHVRSIIGLSYVGLGEYRSAEPHLAAALELRRELHGDRSPEAARGLIDWAEFQHADMDHRGAEATLREALAILRPSGYEESPDIALVLGRLGDMLSHLQEHQAAEPLAREAVEMHRRLLGDEHPDLAHSMKNLAMILMVGHQYEEAEQLMRRALAIRRLAHGDEHPAVATAILRLGVVLLRTGHRASEAEALFREALDRRTQLLGLAHPDTAEAMQLLGSLLSDRGRLDEAEALTREALDVARRAYGDRHVRVAWDLDQLALIHELRSDYAAAEPLLREALDIRREELGEDDPLVAQSLNNLGLLLQRKGDLDEAEACLRRALALRLERIEGDPYSAAGVHNNLALVLLDRGDLPGGAAHLRQCLGIVRPIYPDGHALTVTALANLGTALEDLSDYEGAEVALEEALAMTQRLAEGDHWRFAAVADQLAMVRQGKGATGEAESLAREALEMRRRLFGDRHSQVARSLFHLAAIRLARGDLDGAEADAREAMSIYEEVSPGGWRQFGAMSVLGGVLAARGEFEEAEQLLLDGLAGMEESPKARRARVRETRALLAGLYERWGRPADAAKYLAALAEGV